MAIIATPSRRQLAMAVMLGLATAGAVIRYYAPNPSTLRDVGSLLLVMWLPAVGNLVGYFVRKIPRRAPPVTEFADAAAFAPNLQVLIESTGPAEIDPLQRRCVLLVGRDGFTARTERPLAELLHVQGEQALAVELLHPAVALRKLKPGTAFHLLVETTAVAKGRVADN